MQKADNQEEEEEHYSNTAAPHAMTATYYAAAPHPGHNFSTGRNDESSFETATNLDDATVGGTSLPPQALPYNSQYMGSYPPAAGWYAAPLPPTSNYAYHPPPAQQHMYSTFHIPPTYGSSPPVQYQPLYYPANDTPPPRRGRGKSS